MVLGYRDRHCGHLSMVMNIHFNEVLYSEQNGEIINVKKRPPEKLSILVTQITHILFEDNLN